MALPPIEVPPGVSGGIDNYIEIMRGYARRARFILEIGIGVGDGSTWAFQSGLDDQGPWMPPADDRLHISVDNFMLVQQLKWTPDEQRWHLVHADSTDPASVSLVQAICGDRKADLIFIDTIHDYEHMSRELPVWVQMAHDKTNWLFHDTYMFGVHNHMTDAIRDFAQANGWIYEDLRTDAHGLGRMYKP